VEKCRNSLASLSGFVNDFYLKLEYKAKTTDD